MKRKTIVSIALVSLLALALLSAAACKTSGMAVTSRGQVLRLDIVHPDDLPDQGEDNLDVIISNVGINNIQDVLLEVELPPQLIVLDQTNGEGINVTHAPGSNTYRFTFGNVQVGENSLIRFRVRTAFGTLSEIGGVKATAWQSGLPGDKLIETAAIKLRRTP